jgi:hypothetical protein
MPRNTVPSAKAKMAIVLVAVDSTPDPGFLSSISVNIFGSTMNPGIKSCKQTLEV